MRLSNYTLSPTRINNAKAKDKLYKLSDGGGLFVEVSPAGQKTWQYQYRFGGSRRDVKIGRYPEVGVADARERHFELRALLERGIDPADARRQELSERKQRAADAVAPADEFETFSKRWVREWLMTKSDTTRRRTPGNCAMAPSRSSYAGSCCMSCPAASTGSGTTACWPTATGGTTWRWRASCCR
jgi:hypothetical protein